MKRHLTYTGVDAGTYLCLRLRKTLGHAPTGVRNAGEQGVHYIYAAAWVLKDSQTCPDCRHVAACPDPTLCRECQGLGYSPE